MIAPTTIRSLDTTKYTGCQPRFPPGTDIDRKKLPELASVAICPDTVSQYDRLALLQNDVINKLQLMTRDCDNYLLEVCFLASFGVYLAPSSQ